MASRLLYLVRHGVHEKDPATAGPDGNEDGELTEAGREQARLLEHGSQQAAAAVRRHAGVPQGGGPPELLVSHGNLIGWFLCEALDLPRWRWLSLPLHYNCALTVIVYREGRPPSLMSYNDMGHLPAELRGTDYPEEFRV